MLRKSIILLICLLVVTSIPVSLFAGQVSISDGYVNLPAGGGIVFPGGSILSDPAGITGPMGPPGPSGMITNADIVSCYGQNFCYCGSGKVVKAVISAKCALGEYINTSAAADQFVTGWEVDCQKIDVTYSPDQVVSIEGHGYYVVTHVGTSSTAPQKIIISCTTP